MKYKTRAWKPFQRENYHWAWHEKHLIGVMQEVGRDLYRSHQRIWKGYCDYDIFSIFSWFLGIMPTMLQEYKENLHGYPDAPGLISHRVILADSDKEGNESFQAWNDVLNRLIFLLKEADEGTCTHENPYEEDYFRALKEFEGKYGSFGEKMMTKEERKEEKSGKGIRWYTLHDVDEYRPLAEKYIEEEKNIAQYRWNCKNEALELFSKWFYDLWD